MRFIWNGFVSALSLRLRSIRGWFIVLLLPLLTISALTLMPVEEISAPVRVGVALPEKGAEEFWDLLEERDGTVITFIEADEQTIEKMVATAQWDCGLILAEDFSEEINELDTDRLFTLQIGPGSAAYPLVRESVAACMAELINEEIAEEYMLRSGIIHEEMLESVRPRLEEILPESDRVLVSMQTVDGAPLNALTLADSGVNAILRWMVSAVVLVWMLLAATDLGRWLETGAVRRMRSVRSQTVLMLSHIGADMTLAAAAGGVSLFLLGDGWMGFVGVLSYVVFWAMGAVVLGHFRPVWSSLPVAMPFFPVLSLLLSSAIVDIGLFIPSVSEVSHNFPAALFLRVCDGDIIAAGILSGFSLTCLAGSVCIDRFS